MRSRFLAVLVVSLLAVSATAEGPYGPGTFFHGYSGNDYAWGLTPGYIPDLSHKVPNYPAGVVGSAAMCGGIYTGRGVGLGMRAWSTCSGWTGGTSDLSTTWEPFIDEVANWEIIGETFDYRIIPYHLQFEFLAVSQCDSPSLAYGYTPNAAINIIVEEFHGC